MEEASSQEHLMGENFLPAAYVEAVYKQDRKVGGGLLLKAFDGWMHFRALDGDSLPRGKYFDKFRSKCRDTQFDQVMARVRRLTNINSQAN